jgi:hypothetical protein
MVPLEALGAKTVIDTIVAQHMKSRNFHVQHCPHFEQNPVCGFEILNF